jgi:hypothetical protein
MCYDSQPRVEHKTPESNKSVRRGKARGVKYPIAHTGDFGRAPVVVALVIQRDKIHKSREGFNQIVVVFGSDTYDMPLADCIATPAGGEYWCMRAPNARVTTSSIMALPPVSPRSSVNSVAINFPHDSTG